jgi:glycine cleavage system H protein
MEFPAQFHYTKEHEWIEVKGDVATIGITKFAIEQLGDVVHLDLPKVGTAFKSHDTFGTIESTKTVSDLYTPASGKVTEVNTALTNAPEEIAEDPYVKGWLIKMTLDEAPTKLMTAAEYAKYVAEDSH